MTTTNSPLRSALVAALSIAILAVWAWVGASAASAATFTVYSCQDPGNHPVASGGWTATHTSGFGITTALNCQFATSTMWIQVGPGPAGADYTESQGATLTFAPPTGVTISSFQLYVPNAYAESCATNCGVYGMGNVWVTDSTLADPIYDYRILGSGNANPGLISASPGNAVNVSVTASCDDQNTSKVCPASARAASIAVQAGVFKLFDSTSPQVSNVTGPLTSTDTLSGTQAIDFRATDSGSGIYSAIVDVDGQQVQEPVLNSNNGMCVNLGQTTDGTRAFASPQPCATTVNAAVNLDTTQLRAGRHHLQVYVDDAAGDRATVYDGSITVNNPPANTTAPSLADVTHPTATAAQVGDVLHMTPGTWSPAGATTTYSWQSCAGDGSACNVLPGQAGADYTVRSTDAGRILLGYVTASDQAGAAPMLAGASQPVQSADFVSGGAGSGGNGGTGGVGGGGGSGASGAGGNGGVSITITPTGPGTTTTVALGSTAKWRVSLKVTPRKVHRRTRITLTGKVLTALRPPAGKLIYLQARTASTKWRGQGRKRHRVTVHSAWVSFETLRAATNGTFKSSYRFRVGGSHRYQFEAVAPKEGGYRNATGTSKPVTVTES